MDQLKPYAGKRITEKKIREILNIQDYQDYYKAMQYLLQNHLIEPVLSSGSNGMNPPLYKRYRVQKEEKRYDDILPEIRLLHTSLNVEGYLNQPGKYKEHRGWIQPLDSWLKENQELLKTSVSINERSFQIFHQEKALRDNKDLAAVLHFNSGIRDVLNYYETPEPFFTHNIKPYDEKTTVNILISENKDTWYTLRKIMNASGNMLFGIGFHILMYGEGKKINRRYDTLSDYDEITLDGLQSRYYYIGDIDYEGIGIFNELTEQNPALQIKLMTPLYIMMLEKSKEVSLPFTKDMQVESNPESFLAEFEPQYRDMIVKILQSRRYIPQEILNYGDFIKIIEGSADV
ncbi:MAG: Wadjet anti-phage system protein JetD domain-containing protein [Caldicoprobacterales bacterium]|nr:hypothetical protein [Clostridiales bacterium]